MDALETETNQGTLLTDSLSGTEEPGAEADSLYVKMCLEEAAMDKRRKVVSEDARLAVHRKWQLETESISGRQLGGKEAVVMGKGLFYWQ